MSENNATLRIQLLGPVRAWHGAVELELGSPQRRAVLGMLASARHGVSRAELIEGLWGPDAPASAKNAVHGHICGLRRILEPCRVPRARSQALAAHGPGYRLRWAPGALDVELLNERLTGARRLAAREPGSALSCLEAALSLWHGDPLGGIPGPWACIERTRLEELRQTATTQRLDIMLRLGGHHDVLPELTALARRYPLRERFRELLMMALYRCGRQADALATFADARRELAAQLGIEPGPGLRRMQALILAADPVLDSPRLVGSAATAGPSGIA